MEVRFRLFVIALMALVSLAVWTLPEWWALAFPDSVTAEVFPGLEMDAQSAFVALPAAVRETYLTLYNGDEDTELTPNPEWALALVRGRLLQQDQQAPEAAEPFEAPAGSQIRARGTFASADLVREAQGDLVIYELVNATYLLHIESNFSSSRAAGIHIIFTRNPDPLDPNGVGVDYIDVGQLRGNTGAQQYTVPASVDFNRYPVLALYAPDYDAVLATATLR